MVVVVVVVVVMMMVVVVMMMTTMKRKKTRKMTKGCVPNTHTLRYLFGGEGGGGLPSIQSDIWSQSVLCKEKQPNYNCSWTILHLISLLKGGGEGAVKRARDGRIWPE